MNLGVCQKKPRDVQGLGSWRQKKKWSPGFPPEETSPKRHSRPRWGYVRTTRENIVRDQAEGAREGQQNHHGKTCTLPVSAVNSSLVSCAVPPDFLGLPPKCCLVALRERRNGGPLHMGVSQNRGDVFWLSRRISAFPGLSGGGDSGPLIFDNN